MKFEYEVDKDKLIKAMDFGNAIIPIIVGCVRYDFDTSPAGHCTAFVRELFRKDDPSRKSREKNRAVDVIFPDEGKIEGVYLEIRNGFGSRDYGN
jgi:hypothetical protein